MSVKQIKGVKATKKPKKGFQKGSSGNPNGRPKGARNKVSMLAEQLLEGEAEQVTRKCIELAKEGDHVALRLVMERLLPPRRSRPVSFDLPKSETAEDLLFAYDAVLSAVATSVLTTDEGQRIVSMLDGKRKLLEAVDHERRIIELEDKAAEYEKKFS